MDASSEQVPSRWSERTIGERAVIAAWRAVAAHLAADAVGPGSPAEQQVASGGAGVDDGVTEDALPPVLRKRAG